MNEKTFDHIMKVEGRYVNDPADSGGETIYGISRVNHSDWSGWKVVDRAKQEGGEEELDSDDLFDELRDQVWDFYTEYLEANGADRIDDGRVALALADHCTTCGKGGSTRMAQALANGWGYPCDVDGLDGPGTRQAVADLNAELNQAEPSTMACKDALPLELFAYRIEHYLAIADGKARGASEQERAALFNHFRSWVRRSIGILHETAQSKD